MKEQLKTTEMLQQKRAIIQNISREIEDNNEGRDYREQRLREKLGGRWRVISHTVDGTDYLDYFIATRLKDYSTRNLRIEETYEFKERVCLKTLDILCDIAHNESTTPYHYRVRLTSSYSFPENNRMSVILESGYLYQLLDKRPQSVTDFEPDNKPVEIVFRLENGYMILENGDGSEHRELARI